MKNEALPPMPQTSQLRPIHHLFPRLFRTLIKRVLCPAPRRINACGFDSYVYFPRRIDGPQYISIGKRSSVDKYGWLSAVDSYAGAHFTPAIRLGDDVHIGRFSCITAISSIMIEDGCLLSEHVYISDHAHGVDPQAGLLVHQPLHSKGDVVLGKHCFVGYRACILPGVTLGQHCVVGANAVVTRSFPAYSMIAGAPARLIKRYNHERRAWIAAEDAHD